VRVSDQTEGAPYKTAAGYAFPYGDYFEIAVDADGRTHLIWGEDASYSGRGGNLVHARGIRIEKVVLSAPLNRIDADDPGNGVEMPVCGNNALNVLAEHHGGVHRVACLKSGDLTVDF
jgi:hypothetical protein